MREPIKIEILSTRAFLYIGSRHDGEVLAVRTMLEHNNNRAEMIAALMADKFDLENKARGED